jgi:hypothetical protein
MNETALYFNLRERGFFFFFFFFFKQLCQNTACNKLSSSFRRAISKVQDFIKLYGGI